MNVSFLESLQATPIFQGVCDEVMGLLHPSMKRVYQTGELIIAQGALPEYLYVVLDGTVDVSAGLREKRVYLLSRVAGEVVGEQAFLESYKHSADVWARGWATMLRIPASVVERMLQDAVFSRNLLAILSAKLRDATRQRYVTLAQKALLFSHFSSHVNPQLVSGLLTEGEDYGRPQQIENAIVMFADLRDFTRLSSSMSPLDVASQLAPYYATLVNCVHDSHGIVDKFIGDAIMAVWGHPALGSISADDVFSSCLSMMKAVAAVNFGGESVRIGVGLNVGSVFMGNIGTDEKRSFTVLGDAVNFASRYEAANKTEHERYSLTLGPAMFELLDESHRGLLVARSDVSIKGAPSNKQTIYSIPVEGVATCKPIQ